MSVFFNVHLYIHKAVWIELEQTGKMCLLGSIVTLCLLMKRCHWCPPDDSLYCAYHDNEWGKPLRDGQKLFELLNLEGAQAGLSWRTVLGKRERYREVFSHFSIDVLLKWTDADVQRALGDPGIIRNRLKVNAVVRNARALQQHFNGDYQEFADFLWSFVDGKPIQNHFTKLSDYPAHTLISDRMSKELKKRDFTFVGTTICYAFMQSSGMVNDHGVDCFLYGGK